ncbi:MAG: hypothetical protein MJ228_04845 [Bacilli bacterium]|nr:hypothetical protein [Bacilli bacterium]
MGNIAEIINITNIALTVAFWSVFAIFLLGFLRGLLLGWRYGTYRIIFMTILILVCVLTVKPLAGALASLDLRAFGVNISTSMTVDLGTGTPAEIWINVTSLKETVSNFLSDLMVAANINADPTTIANYTIGFATSIAAVLLLLIEALLVIIVGNLLCFLLWHVAFKFITPKEKRKKKTKRVISGFEEAVTAVLVFAMFLTPLTGLVNTLNRGFERLDENDENYSSVVVGNEQIGLLYSVFDTYENSLFNKAFFSWYVDSNGMSYDQALLNFISTIEVDKDMQVSFIKELGNVAKMGSYVVNSGLLSQDAITAETVLAFVAGEQSTKLLNAIGNSGLVQAILPFALEVALNNAEVFKMIGTAEGIDVSSYDTAKTLEELVSLFETVQESGIIGDMIDQDGKISLGAESIKKLFKVSNISFFNDVVSTLSPSKLALLNDIVKSAIYVKLVKEYQADADSEEVKLGLKDLFPELTEDDLKTNENGVPLAVPSCIKDIDLASELALVLDSLIQIVNVDARFLNIIIDPLFEEDSNGLGDNAINDIISLVFENADSIEHWLDGTPVDGITENYCLFDSKLLSNAIPTILKMIESAMNDALSLSDEKAISLEEVITDYKEKETADRISSVKEEVHSIFQVLDPLLDSEEGKDLVLHFDTLPGIYFDDKGGFLGAKPELLDAFASAVSNLDKSIIFTNVLPKTMEGFLIGDQGVLGSMGLDITLDLNCIGTDGKSHFGRELANLIRSYNECQEALSCVMSLTSGSSNFGAIEKTFLEMTKYKTSSGESQIVTLLSSIANNKIFNPVFEENGHPVYNKNISELFGSLFEMFGLTGEDLKGEIKDIVMDENFDASNEFESLIGMVKYLCEENILGSLSELSIDSLGKISFGTLFNHVAGSELLQTVIGSVIDNSLKDNAIFTYIDQGGETVQISFKSIEDWTTEGEALDAMMKYASEIGDISNIDLASLNPEMISSVFGCFAKSDLFVKTLEDGTKDYVFPDYLANKLVKILKGAGSAGQFFTNLIETYEGGVYEVKAADPSLDSSYSVLVDTLLEAKQNATIAECKDLFVQEGEVLASIIGGLSYSGAFDLVSDGSDVNLGKLKTPYFRNLLLDISNSMLLSKTGLAQIVKTLVDVLKESNDSFANCNVMFAYNQANAANRESVANSISDMLEIVMDPVSGILASDGKIDSTILSNVINLGGKSFLAPLLHTLNDSPIFSTLTPFQKNTAGLKDTAFTGLIKTALRAASWYGDDDVTNAVFPHIQEMIETSTGGWDAEIDNFIEVVDDLQVMNLSLDANLDFSSFFTEEKFGIDIVYDLFKDINGSYILFPGFPVKLESALEALQNGTLATSGISLSGANIYYMGSALSDVGSHKYANVAIDDEETLKLVMTIRYSSALTAVDFGDFTALAGETIDTLTDMLALFAQSNIFNSKKSGASSTVFQSVMGKVLSNDAIKKYFYSSVSPKDKANLALYTDAESKAMYLAGSMYPVVSNLNSNSNTSNLNGDGNDSLRTLLKSLILDSDLTDVLSSGSMDTLNSAKLDGLLKSLNACDWTYDLVPNAIADTAKNLNIAEIELRRVNPFYCYGYDITKTGSTYYNSGTLLAEKDYTNRYDDAEMSLVAELIKLVKDNSDIVSSFTDVTKLQGVETMLLTLNESYVFHMADAGFDLLDATPGSGIVANNLSVFEQIMYSLYTKTGLSDLAYNAVYDGNYASASAKTLSMVKNLSDDLWSNEVSTLIYGGGNGLLGTAHGIHLFDGGNNSISSDNLMSITPTALGNLLYAVNRSTIVSDLVKYQIMDVLDDTIGFKNFSKVTTSFVPTAGASSYTIDLALPTYTLEIEASAAPTVSYKVAGSVNVITPSGTGPYVYTLYDGSAIKDRPLANAITIENGTNITSVKATFTVDNEISLTREAYDTVVAGEHVGAIAELIKVVNGCLYDGSDYINLESDPNALANVFTTPGNLTKIVNFIENEHSFFASGYDLAFKSSNNPSFTAGDVTVAGILNFHTAAGTMNLLSYMPHFDENDLKPAYADVRSVFEGVTIAEASAWLDGNIANAAAFYGFYSLLPNIQARANAIGDFAIGSLTIDDYLALTPGARYESFESYFKSGFCNVLYTDLREAAIADARFTQNNISASAFEVTETTFADFVNMNKETIIPLLRYNRLTGVDNGATNISILESAANYSATGALRDVLVVTFEKAIFEALLAKSPLAASSLVSMTPFGASGYYHAAANIANS